MDKLQLAIEALQLIAAPKRADGTYNRCREACEVIAHQALNSIQDSQQTSPSSENLSTKVGGAADPSGEVEHRCNTPKVPGSTPGGTTPLQSQTPYLGKERDANNYVRKQASLLAPITEDAKTLAEANQRISYLENEVEYWAKFAKRTQTIYQSKTGPIPISQEAQVFVNKLYPCEPPCDSYGICSNCYDHSNFECGYVMAFRAEQSRPKTNFRANDLRQSLLATWEDMPECPARERARGYLDRDTDMYEYLKDSK